MWRRWAEPSTSAQGTVFDAMFRVHYSESSGFDCGFHNEPNPHVDDWFHSQCRESPEESYEYEPASLDARSPIGALWQILDEIGWILRTDKHQ